MSVSITIFLILLNFFVGFFLSFLFCALVIWWLTLALCLDLFFFCVSVSIVDFWFVITLKLLFKVYVFLAVLVFVAARAFL